MTRASTDIVANESDLAATAREMAGAERLSVDLEASGMFSYRADLCTVQLAWADRVVVVDALAVDVRLLEGLLGADGPLKIIHDVAFDSRLLASAGIALGDTHDTSIMAKMLGRKALGLSALLDAELGVHIDKDMQQHDWRERPLDDRSLYYLTEDVGHLAALDAKLWAEVETHGITQEVVEETRYRIACAIAAVREPHVEPPYVRVKGNERLTERELAALRVIADLREQEAERRDVPPHRVASNATLVAIARARPTQDTIGRLRGVAIATPDERAFATRIVDALARVGDTLPEEERARLDRPRIAPGVARARRDRETRLMAWRRAMAAERAVDEQVVLPGHCLKDAAEAQPATVEGLAAIPGFGRFRAERYGEAILQTLRGDESA